VKNLLAVLFAALVLAGGARADGPGVVAAEFGCGYVGGAAVAVSGILFGNLVRDDEFASGGLIGALIGYPAGVGLGSWGAGEIWGDDSANDWATVGAAVGGAYASVGLGVGLGRWKGLIIGMLAAPAVSTAAYNVVKTLTKEEDEPTSLYISASFSF